MRSPAFRISLQSSLEHSPIFMRRESIIAMLVSMRVTIWSEDISREKMRTGFFL